MSHDHDDGISNPSGNRPFEDVLRVNGLRRNILKGSMAAAAASFFNIPNLQASSLISFSPVPVAGGDGFMPRISDDYYMRVILPWGDPLYPGSQETIGIGHDGMWYFPLSRGNGRDDQHGILCINHEFGDNAIVIGKAVPDNLADVQASQYAHGVSVIEIERRPGKNMQWKTVNENGVARRIHGNSPVAFSGPVAGSPLLDNLAGNPALGTLNNCGNGYTPWGTYLTCEENFNGYFGANGSFSPSSAQSRYGLSSTGFGYGWHLFDERFDLTNPNYANEANRFGWMVEIDPYDPGSLPVKRTAMGRFKHEGCAIAIGQGGRAVGYMGDDERFDYIYKFVSEGNYQTMLSQGMSPLDHGKLYAARFNDDGTGDWMELSMDNPAIAAVFSSQDQVLTYARMAADLAGATPMDRPEWTTLAPDGYVYCTLTNNSRRTVADAANPQAPNRNGHIIRWLDSDNHVGLSFIWDIFIIADDTHGTEESFASPDGLWCDPDGRLIIQTDGGQADGLRDQMLVADTNTGEIFRLLEGVDGCEVTGIALTPDRSTLFCNLQHPDPDTGVPRDATVVLERRNGGIVGS